MATIDNMISTAKKMLGTPDGNKQLIYLMLELLKAAGVEVITYDNSQQELNISKSINVNGSIGAGSMTSDYIYCSEVFSDDGYHGPSLTGLEGQDLNFNVDDDCSIVMNGDYVQLRPKKGYVQVSTNGNNNNLELVMRPDTGRMSFIGTKQHPVDVAYLQESIRFAGSEVYIYGPENGDLYICDYQDEGGLGIMSDGSISIYGTIKFENIPTSDPHTFGVVWNDNGTLKISLD